MIKLELPEWQRPEIINRKASHNPANDIPYPEEIKEAARQDILSKAERFIKPEAWGQMCDAVNDKIDSMIKEHETRKKCCANCIHEVDYTQEPCCDCYHYDKFEARKVDNDIVDDDRQAGIHANIGAPLGGWRDTYTKSKQEIIKKFNVPESKFSEPLSSLTCDDCKYADVNGFEPPCNDCVEHSLYANIDAPLGGWRGERPEKNILKEAYNIINGNRLDQYGSPEDSFQIIADFWTVYLKYRFEGADIDLQPKDTAIMMSLFKHARMLGQKPCRDNPRDAIGYIAIAADRLMDDMED